MSKRKQKKLSTEELAKTQVLNLDDVQKLAKYEKLVSKKPALIVALAGVFSIIVGVSAQTVVSLTDANQPKPMPSVNQKVQSRNGQENQLVCSKTEAQPAAEISIKTTYTVNYKNNNSMTTYTKAVDVTPTSTTSVNALTSIQNGMVAFKEFEKTSITGYTVVVSNKESGYEVLVTVDPNVLDQSQLSPVATSNAFVNPDVVKGSSKDQVKTGLTSKGYTCK